MFKFNYTPEEQKANQSLIDDFNNRKIIKGKLFLGNQGNGKTTDMIKYVNTLKGSPERFMTAIDIVQKCFEPEYRQDPMSYLYYLADQSQILTIDDMGAEPLKINVYGTELEPISILIRRRYAISKYRGFITNITTNLNEDELKTKYTDAVVGRLIEMCEWLHYRGPSFRK